MEFKLYDTLTREKRVFVPIDRDNVRMYVCGPTVYDFAHIGNARPVIVFDVLFRLLRHLYGESHVTYVRNITDVDDKINARAAERGISIRQVTEETCKDFSEDVKALGCLPPTVEPRATEHIAAMKEIIEKLVKAGCAYVAEDHVLFNVSAMPDYGKLSRRSLDEMIAGARVEVAPYKKEPTDFVLWKPSKPGEPAWDSPAGIKTPGRPGWHIECSAMAWKHLGETFDIHGGGIDLVFPHHENEIAQSRCAFHTKVMTNYWMHNGFLQVEGEKMAKSAGNFVTIHELLKDWPGEVLRLNMLRTHYRQPIDWTVKGLEESSKILDGWYDIIGDETNSSGTPDADFVGALCDDLNTPNALTQLHRIANEIRGPASGLAQTELKRTLRASGILVGLMAQSRRKFMQAYPRRAAVDEAKVVSLIEARKQARAAKNFQESDRIRDELAAIGVVLKDSKDGTTWEIAR
jgi:cysteinyl-tRNA synthetase